MKSLDQFHKELNTLGDAHLELITKGIARIKETNKAQEEVSANINTNLELIEKTKQELNAIFERVKTESQSIIMSNQKDLLEKAFVNVQKYQEKKFLEKSGEKLKELLAKYCPDGKTELTAESKTAMDNEILEYSNNAVDKIHPQEVETMIKAELKKLIHEQVSIFTQKLLKEISIETTQETLSNNINSADSFVKQCAVDSQILSTQFDESTKKIAEFSKELKAALESESYSPEENDQLKNALEKLQEESMRAFNEYETLKQEQIQFINELVAKTKELSLNLLELNKTDPSFQDEELTDSTNAQ